MSDVNKYRSLEALFCCKAAGSSRNTKETLGETRDVIENFLYSLALGMFTNLSSPFPVITCRVSAGGVRTLAALHYGRKTKIESFVSCRGRVNVSGSSRIV